jgi:hypothetical protein
MDEDDDGGSPWFRLVSAVVGSFPIAQSAFAFIEPNVSNSTMIRVRKNLSRFLNGTIDYWSIPHFLFGAVTALAAAAFIAPSGTVFFATLALAILWELIEWKFLNIYEDIGNRVGDVILPLVAFWATDFYVTAFVTGSDRKISLFVVVTALFFWSNFLAWRARARHDRDFMN